MKLPPKNSNQHKIVALLLEGAMPTLQEGIERHGNFNLSLAEVGDLYADLVVRGCAEQVGPRWRASIALMLHAAPPAEPERPLVPPRTVPPFRPLSRRHIPSVRGLREGSNDLRGVPSLYPSTPTGKEAP